MIINLGDLRPAVASVVNFKVDEPDEDFEGTADNPWSVIDDAINEAVEDDVTFLAENTHSMLFSRFDDSLVWGSGERTFVLPDFMKDVDIIRIDDETFASPGSLLWVYDRGEGYEPRISWRDMYTMQWGTSGPSSDVTLGITFIPSPPTLVNEMDEPIGIPRRFRRMIVWNAAIILRIMAEDSAPGEWYNRRQEWREKAVLALSKGRPRMTNQPQVGPIGDF